MVKTFVFFVSIDLVCFFNACDSHSNPCLNSGIGIEAHTTKTVSCPTKSKHVCKQKSQEDLGNEHQLWIAGVAVLHQWQVPGHHPFP